MYLSIYGIGAIKNPSTYIYTGRNELSGERKIAIHSEKEKKSPKWKVQTEIEESN